MIVNPYSTTALTLDLLSTGLAAATLFKTGALVFQRAKVESVAAEKLTGREDQLYLVFWMGAVLLLIRLALWPFFYLVLQSFVPEVEGTMCIFGVRNLLPTLTRVLELIKPLLFFCGTLWLILFRLERFGRKAQGGKSMLLLLGICSIAALFDSAGSAVLWIRASADLAVSCCTTITDIPTRFTVWVPVALFGPGFTTPLWSLYFGLNVLVIVNCLLGYRVVVSGKKRGIIFSAISGMAFINAVVSTLAYIEVIAPRLMHMPFHHCIYCFVQQVVDAPLILALFILGCFFLMAVSPAWYLARSWADEKILGQTIRSLLFFGGIFLGGSLLMVAVHLST